MLVKAPNSCSVSAAMSAPTVEQLLAERVDGRHRGFGAVAEGLTVAELGAQRGLSLAPHGKTAMAPQLVRRQLEAGAWGMTAATVQQLAVMRAAGARRVIVANEVVGAAETAWLARERAAGCEVYCLVDSVAGVRQLDAGLAAADAARALPVLVEIGGARAGCRTDDDALAVVAAVEAAPRLVL